MDNLKEMELAAKYAKQDETTLEALRRVALEFETAQQKIKRIADKLQTDATTDKNGKRKAVRTKAVQSLLRLAQSSVMRKLAEYGD